MFRISQYMQELKQPREPLQVRKPSGPVVIWNLIRRCNLTCKHCYSVSADIDFPGELNTRQVFAVMDDLRAFGVPVLILSLIHISEPTRLDARSRMTSSA